MTLSSHDVFGAGGLLDADPTIVGLVILAVALTAVLYVFGRLRTRRSGGGG